MLTKLFKAALKVFLVVAVCWFIVYAAATRPESFKAAVLGFAGSIAGAVEGVWHWSGHLFS